MTGLGPCPVVVHPVAALGAEADGESEERDVGDLDARSVIGDEFYLRRKEPGVVAGKIVPAFSAFAWGVS